MILLSDELPLRRSSDMSVWFDDAPLPWVYGRVTVSPICISQDRTEWLIADHPISGVSSVAIGNDPCSGWQHLNRLDETGHSIAVLRLSQPAKEGSTPSVSVSGALDARSGTLIEHPAAIARDILTRCGRDCPADAFLGLQDALPEASCGLSVTDGTLREVLAKLFDPFSVLWNASNARAVYIDANRPPVLELTPFRAAQAQAVTALDDVATHAHVLFDCDYSTGQCRQSLSIVAPESAAQYGTRTVTYEYPHIHRAALALELAQARLSREAAPVWQVEAEVDHPAAAYMTFGDVLQLLHPHLPVGNAVIESITHQNNQTASIRAICWQPAQVMLARHSQSATANASRPSYVYKDGIATLIILDDAGSPIAHAMVMLDNLTGARTSAQGEVSFKTPRGPHTLTVYADGYEPFEMDVTL